MRSSVRVFFRFNSKNDIQGRILPWKRRLSSARTYSVQGTGKVEAVLFIPNQNGKYILMQLLSCLVWAALLGIIDIESLGINLTFLLCFVSSC